MSAVGHGRGAAAERPLRVRLVAWGVYAIEFAARGNLIRALSISGTPPLGVVPEDIGHAYDATNYFVLASKTFLSPTEKRAFATSTTGRRRRTPSTSIARLVERTVAHVLTRSESCRSLTGHGRCGS